MILFEQQEVTAFCRFLHLQHYRILFPINPSHFRRTVYYAAHRQHSTTPTLRYGGHHGNSSYLPLWQPLSVVRPFATQPVAWVDQRHPQTLDSLRGEVEVVGAPCPLFREKLCCWGPSVLRSTTMRKNLRLQQTVKAALRLM